MACTSGNYTRRVVRVHADRARGGLAWAEVEGRRRLEVGWSVLPSLRGRGYATEIARAGLAFAREEPA